MLRKTLAQRGGAEIQPPPPPEKTPKGGHEVENSLALGLTHRRGDDVVLAVAVPEHVETSHGVYHILRNDGSYFGDVHYGELKLLRHGNKTKKKAKKEKVETKKGEEKMLSSVTFQGPACVKAAKLIKKKATKNACYD